MIKCINLIFANPDTGEILHEVKRTIQCDGLSAQEQKVDALCGLIKRAILSDAAGISNPSISLTQKFLINYPKLPF